MKKIDLYIRNEISSGLCGPRLELPPPPDDYAFCFEMDQIALPHYDFVREDIVEDIDNETD